MSESWQMAEENVYFGYGGPRGGFRRGRRGPFLLGAALAAAVVLSGCGGSDPEGEPAGNAAEEAPPVEDAVTEAAGEDAAGEPAEESASGGDGELDRDCLEAVATVGLIEPALELAAQKAELTEARVGELFDPLGAFIENFPEDKQAAYETYREAALSAVDLPRSEVDEILARADVDEAQIALQDKLRMMPGCA